MAGRIVTSTLNNDTGVLATQNGMTGICKAWINYDGSTQTLNGSFNVSSITYNGTGDYTINFTTAMPNANYCAVKSCTSTNATDALVAGSTLSQTTTAFRFVSIYVSSLGASGTKNNAPYNSVAIFSS